MDNIRRNKAEVKIEYPSTPTPLDSNHRAERSNRDDDSIASIETEKITNCTRAREGKKIEEGTRWNQNWKTKQHATRHTAWKTIRDKEKIPTDMKNILFDKARLTKAIADSGCTSTLVLPGTPIKNVRPATNPITLVDAKGGKLVTTHEGEIDIPGLPIQARRAHICPDLAHSSLVSIKQLADAGCQIIYDETEV